jgi:hypothetical protein
MHAEYSETLDQAASQTASAVPADTQPAYRPESPFLPEPEYDREQDHEAMDSREATANYREAIETPFITEYELDGVETESAESALHREIMEELYDDEFNEALEDLVNSVRGVYEDRFQSELEQGSAQAEQQLWMYLQPLQGELETALDRLVEGLAQIDNESLTEAQLDHYLESFEYETSFEQPEFENFFKKIWKKAKKLAKKGLKTLKKLSPAHIVLGKLRKLVRPLLMRVLKFALNKVPARYRPLARRLARRFLKGAMREVDESEFDDELIGFEDLIEASELEAIDAEAATLPSSIVATEFDALLAGYLIEGEDFDEDPCVARYLNQEQFEDENTVDVLNEARDRFIREITTVESEAEAVVQIERFVPAILMGLKLGIKLIGRRRVVNLLAKLVAKLIRRFVGRGAAVPLSRALVDAGLGLVRLEAAEDLDYASGEIIAETIQEMVDEFVTSAPQEAFEDEELMEVYVQEAFDHAVARNFPPQLIRRGLRQAPDSKGTWVVLPRGRRRKHYKKFTEVFDVKLTAPMAKQVESFGGHSLYEFLKDQLGVPVDKQDVSARVHVYEGIRDTSLSDISHLEKSVDGLGSRARSAWMKIHPLTPRAAAVLIPKHVGLATPTSPRFLADRTRTGVGQRFYYLEVPGARILRAPVAPPEKVGARRPAAPGPARASEVNLTIDFRSREIRLYDFLSEAKATDIAQTVRAGKSRVALVRAVRATLRSALQAALSGAPGRHLRIRREVPAEEGMMAGLAPVLRFVGRTVSDRITSFVIKELLEAMRKDGNAFAQQLVQAADAPADGVTVMFTIARVGEVFDVFSTNTLKRVRALAKLRSEGIAGAMKVEVRPGFHRDQVEKP